MNWAKACPRALTAAMTLAVAAAAASSAAAPPPASPEAEASNGADATFYESAHPSAAAIDLLESLLLKGTERQLNSSDKQIKSVINRSKTLVRLSQPIKVCFENGARENQEMVVNAAMAWVNTGAGIAFDFGPEGRRNSCFYDTGTNRSVIRISLKGKRHYSVIGTEALFVKGEPTMAIGFDDGMQPGLRRAVIIHEFGHALGLLHEHLNPKGRCLAEFNLERMRKILIETRGLEPEEIERDFTASLRGSPEIASSDFDKKSIMIYAMDAEFFNEPATATCMVPQPLQISDIDTAEIRRSYPINPSARDALARANFSDLSLALTSSDLSQASRDGIASYVAALTREPGPVAEGVYEDYATELLRSAQANLQQLESTPQ